MSTHSGVVPRRGWLAAGAAACALALLALHTPPAGGADPRDEAVGTGTNQFLIVLGDAHLSVSAHSGALGERPTGAVRAQGDPDGAGPQEPFKLQGPVTCLRVSGNRAAIKYAFRQAEGSAEPFAGGGVQIFIEDNGDPVGGVAVDRTTFDPPQPAALFALNQGFCEDPNTRLTYDQIESGNFGVSDATP